LLIEKYAFIFIPSPVEISTIFQLSIRRKVVAKTKFFLLLVANFLSVSKKRRMAISIFTSVKSREG